MEYTKSMSYDKNIKLKTLKEKFSQNSDFYINIIALFGAILFLIVNYKQYEWILKMFFDVNSSDVAIAFVGVLYIAILGLLIIYILFFAIIGFYFTKLLCKFMINIVT